MTAATAPIHAPLIDSFGRQIRYLRLSVTDRCDLRCTYCMSERPQFLPKADLLSFEELSAICDVFIQRGVEKIRITGGEPLVRRDVGALIDTLGARLGPDGLRELTLTTNATQLDRHAARLKAAGVKRINVSLDTIDPGRFFSITRGGDLSRVMAGLEAAKTASLAVKINMVALRDAPAGEVDTMIEWAHGEGFDLTLIEVMPMGFVEADRADQFLPLSAVREQLEQKWSLTPLPDQTGGPARYVRVGETGGRLGFITPLTGNFCEGCNRVRLSCTGELHLCLGQESAIDLRAAYRSGGKPAVEARLDAAMAVKPKSHDFQIERGRAPAVARTMAHTGG